MKKIIATPHDRFFRLSMSNPRVARQFFATQLPKHISKIANLETLQIRKDTYLSAKLQLSMTDILFSVEMNGKLGYFYLLVEHKKKSERLTPFQVLQYTVLIMEQHLKEHGGKELPLVCPIILYNGKYPYYHSTDLFTLFGENEVLAREVFLKPVQLVDLTRIPDEELKKEAWLSIMLLCMKHVTDRENSLRWITLMLDNMRVVEQEGGFDYASASFLYLFQEGEIADTENLQMLIHERLSPTLEKTAMNIAQQFKSQGREEGIQIGRQEGMNIAQQFKSQGREEGIQIGRQEGIEKGIEKGKALLAAQLIQQGLLPIETVSELTGLSCKALDALLQKKKTATT